MRTFWISLFLFICFIVWLLNKPIEHKLGHFTGFSSAELNYIDQTFNYSMDQAKPNEQIDWSTSTVNGRIVLTQEFKSKSGSTCRAYTETYRTTQYEQILKGYGCKRSEDEGWCRLRETDAQTCALEDRSFFFGRASQALLAGGELITRFIGGGSDAKSESKQIGIPPLNPSTGLPSLPDVKMPKGSLHVPMPWEIDHEKPVEDNFKK
jgi:hypothetical protein